MSSLSLRSGGVVAFLGVLATVFVVLTGVHLLGGYLDAARQLSQSGGPPGRAEVPASAASGGAEVLPTVPPAASPSPSQPAASKSSSGGAAAALRKLLDQVEIVATRPNVPGYDRGCGPSEGCVFGTEWNDATDASDSHNGCDTRNDVLRRDLVNIVIDPDSNGCVVLSGVLKDPYTGTTVRFQRGWETSAAVQVDHLIPLAAAWDLGAWRWSPAKRATFANDTAHELLAVDGPANMAKGDNTPASWLPPNKAFRCEYGLRYLRSSLHWELPITAADAEVLRHVARKCG